LSSSSPVISPPCARPAQHQPHDAFEVAGPDRDTVLVRLTGLDRLQGVHHQGDHDLAELMRIRQHRGHAFVVLLDQPCSPAAQPATRAETSAITTTKRIASNDPCARSEA
jgi:hypothetical protein